MKILVMLAVWHLPWGDRVSYTRTEPLPKAACEAQAEYLNKHRTYNTDFNYCEDVHNEKENHD